MDNLTSAALCFSIGCIMLALWSIHLNRQLFPVARQSVSTIKLIQPMPFLRGPRGDWSHPDMPIFDEDEAAAFHAWIAEQGPKLRTSALEDEGEQHPVSQSYFERGEGNYSAWWPSPPDGPGWFTLAIDETDDGPHWWWVRRVESAAALAQ